MFLHFPLCHNILCVFHFEKKIAFLTTEGRPRPPPSQRTRPLRMSFYLRALISLRFYYVLPNLPFSLNVVSALHVGDEEAVLLHRTNLYRHLNERDLFFVFFSWGFRPRLLRELYSASNLFKYTGVTIDRLKVQRPNQ